MNSVKNEKFYVSKTRSEYRDEKEKKDVEKATNKKRRLVLIIFILVLVLFFIIAFNILFRPSIILKGSRKVTINYQEQYKEKGYTAKYLGKNVTDDVKTSGKVNSNKLGIYELKYSIKKNIFTKTITRIVEVKDLSEPEIILDGGKKVSVCPYDEYKETGYKAIDNYDGDLTKKVNVKKDKTKYVYEVSDSSGNKAKISRKITYEDNEKPNITLKGGNKIYTFINEPLDDPGVNVTDNCDKEIASKIKVSSGVDTKKLGVYKILYVVVDKSGNKTEVEREVEVIEKGKNGTIYLTFDDGPQEGTTNVILDILKKYNVKATFFVINIGPDSLIKREFDEGHTVALHTATHDYGYVYSSVDNYFSDLNTISKRVEKITGEKSMIIRFPGGSSNTISRKYSSGIMTTLTNEVHKRGYKYYDWNISSGDAGGVKTADGVYNTVISQLSKDRVNMVLFHDIKPYTRDALARIIEYGKNNGYTFDKITTKTDEIHQRVNN